MCGRFVQAQPPDVYARYFGVDAVKTESLAPSYNVAPTKQVYAVAQHESERQLGTFRWGLVPFWAKELKIGSRNINARSETAHEKPAFRDSFAHRRCLIPADGFYEWQKRDRGKLPHFIRAADGEPLALAGLWASWRDPESGERIRTCTILTGDPNRLVAGIHDRMPVMLPEDVWASWLDPELSDVDGVRDLMDVFPADRLAAYAVSTLVNDVRNDLPECIAPLDTGAVD